MTLSNDPETIDETLQRTLLLRSFNLKHMRMETTHGSTLEKLIGVGQSFSNDIGPKRSIYDELPSYMANVMEVFRDYPVQETFGIDLNAAMEMSVSRWRQVVKFVMAMGPKPKPKDNGVNDEMLQLIVELLKVRGGE